MADHTGDDAASPVAVSSSLRAQLDPLLESLSQCEPAPSDDLLLFFHTAIDAVIGHAHSFTPFSTTLTQHAATATRLITLLASTITPSTPLNATFTTLLAPLPTTLSSPLILALTTRHTALLAAAHHSTTSITPTHLIAFDYTVHNIIASSHIAALNQPTTLLTLHRSIRSASAGSGGHGGSGGGLCLELSVEQLDGVLSKMDEVAKLLQSTVG